MRPRPLTRRPHRVRRLRPEPDKFVLPRTSDLRYNWIVVRLDAIDIVELRELLEDAWRMVVPKSVAAAFLGDEA